MLCLQFISIICFEIELRERQEHYFSYLEVQDLKYKKSLNLYWKSCSKLRTTVFLRIVRNY